MYERSASYVKITRYYSGL